MEQMIAREFINAGFGLSAGAFVGLIGVAMCGEFSHLIPLQKVLLYVSIAIGLTLSFWGFAHAVTVTRTVGLTVTVSQPQDYK